MDRRDRGSGQLTLSAHGGPVHAAKTADAHRGVDDRCLTRRPEQEPEEARGDGECDREAEGQRERVVGVSGEALAADGPLDEDSGDEPRRRPRAEAGELAAAAVPLTARALGAERRAWLGVACLHARDVPSRGRSETVLLHALQPRLGIDRPLACAHGLGELRPHHVVCSALSELWR